MMRTSLRSFHRRFQSFKRLRVLGALSGTLVVALACGQATPQQIDHPTGNGLRQVASSSGEGVAAGNMDSTRGNFVSNRIAFEATSTVASTTSTEFESVSSLRGLTIAHRAGVVVVVTGVIEDGPAEFRLVRDGSKVLHPSVFPAAPTNESPTGVSMSFVLRGKDRALCETFRLEWRSPSGVEATLTQANMSMSYQLVRNVGCG